MSVIMSYHTLVDRDANNVSHKWRFIIIIILICITICGLVAAFNFNYIVENFNQNCILSSELAFTDSLSKTYISLDNSSSQYNERSTGTSKNDTEFFRSNRIDEYNTIWGKWNSCRFGSITPLFVSFCALIWISMFIICGHGGNEAPMMPQPWRIVMPAAVFFCIMIFFQLFHVLYVKFGMEKVCDQIAAHLDGTYSCVYLLQQFCMKAGIHDSVSSGDYYLITIASSATSTALWGIAFCVMIIRCICAVDFQLVQVTVSPVDEVKDKKVVTFDENNEKVRISYEDDDDETSFTTAQLTPDRTNV